MEEYVVQVRNGIGKTFFVQRRLRKLGLTRVKKSRKNKYWEMRNVSPKRMKKIRRFCKRHLLHIEVIDQRFTGSGTYRREFFKYYKPFIWKYYFCIYCGRLVSKKNLQVDHIIPIHKAKTSKWVRRYLGRKKFPKGVNDYRNLGAACCYCNLAKSAKMGLWVLRGRIGKSNTYQVIRWLVRFLIIGAGIMLVYLYRENIMTFLGRVSEVWL